MKKKKYIHQDLLVSFFFLLFSLIFGLQGLKVETENAVFPTLCVLIIVALSIPLFISGVRSTVALNKAIEEGKEDVKPEISWERLKGPIITFGAVLIYLLGINYIGFFVATALFVPGYLLLQGYKKVVPILITVALLLGLAFMFKEVLDLVLPSGFLM